MTSRYMYIFKSFAALAAFQAAMHLQPSSNMAADQSDEEEINLVFDDDRDIDVEHHGSSAADTPTWHGQQRALRFHG